MIRVSSLKLGWTFKLSYVSRFCYLLGNSQPLYQRTMQQETMAATLQKLSNVAQSLRCQWQHPLPRQSPVVLLLPSQKTCGILPPRSGGKEHRRLKTITLQSRRKFSVSLIFYCVGFVSNVLGVPQRGTCNWSLIPLLIWVKTHRLLTKDSKIELCDIFSFRKPNGC